MSEEYECLKKEITDYINKDSVEYALLLSGKWGTGKTYLITDILEGKSRNYGPFLKFCHAFFSFCLFLPKCILNIFRFFLYAFLVVIFIILTFIWDGFINWFKWFEIIIYPERMRPRYLSLNGVSSIETLKALIVLSSTRNDAEKKLELITSAFSILETIKFFSLISNTYKKFIFTTRANNLNAPIIFDDLERCKIDGRELFGFIRTYQEKIRKPIVLVGDEDKFPTALSLNDDVYFEIKEKTIGRTFVKHANIREIIGKFLNGEKIEDNITKELKGICIEIFEDVQKNKDENAKTYENLRAFQIAIKEAFTYFKRLSNEIQEDKTFALRFLKVAVALKYNVQLGRFTKENWDNIVEKDEKEKGGTLFPNTIVEEYLLSLGEHSFALTNHYPILSLGKWKKLLFGECLPQDEMDEFIIKNNEEFRTKLRNPEEKLRFIYIMTKDEIESAHKQLEEELQKKKIVNIREIFLAFSAKVHLLNIEKEVKGTNIDQELASLRIRFDNYVNQLIELGKLQIIKKDIEGGYKEFCEDYYLKILFNELQKKFLEIKDIYLEKKNLKILNDTFSHEQKDLSSFQNLLCNECQNVALFNSTNITADKFISLVKKLSPKDIDSMITILYGRYHFYHATCGELDDCLLLEQDVFNEISIRLNNEINIVKQTDIYRAKNYMELKRYIDSILNQINNQKTTTP